MSKTNKILLTVFLVLLLTTVGEIAYYFLYLAPKNTPQTQSTVAATPQINSSTKAVPNTANPDPAIDPTVISQLASARADILTKSHLINEYTGKIGILDTHGGFIPNTKEQYALLIGIVGSKGHKMGKYYTKANLEKAKFMQQKGDNQTLISLNDIKIGDMIIIREELDALISSNSNFLLTIIKQ
jgi:hypothetical protein